MTTKVKQTSLTIWERVMKLLEVFVYVSIYFPSINGANRVLRTEADATAPPLDCRLRFPQLRFRAQAITSIQQTDLHTLADDWKVGGHLHQHLRVNLFFHTRRESRYALEGIDEFLITMHR